MCYCQTSLKEEQYDDDVAGEQNTL